jgi:exosortase
MSTVATTLPNPNVRRHASFVAFLLVSSLAFFTTLNALVRYSMSDGSSSHIVLIPLVAFFLLYVEREKVFAHVSTSLAPGIGLALGGVILFWLASRGPLPQGGNWPLSLETLAVVLVWVAGFFLCYGSVAARTGAFSLLFLLLMVPFPDVILNWAIHGLQEGSTDIAYLIFKAFGTPVLRNGFVLSLPGVTIEVAQECSSIRSSIALFITCLLAAHLYLRTGWKKWLLVLLCFPLSLLKNGIRIATLTLLAIYVNPSFLTGSLHHQGGFVFFFLALVILLPMFLWMARTDRARP